MERLTKEKVIIERFCRITREFAKGGAAESVNEDEPAHGGEGVATEVGMPHGYTEKQAN